MAVFRKLLLLGAVAMLPSGCALAVGAGLGYIVADEIDERDGKLDILEDVRGVGNGAN